MVQDQARYHVARAIYVRYRGFVDRVVEVGEKEAVEMIKRVVREEGLLVGPSTAAAIMTAVDVAGDLGLGKNVVTVAADSVFRYSNILNSV